jgi:chemotaxis protein histidine kinase CheA
MKFIELRNDPTATTSVCDDTFEELQSAFYVRLREDRVRLVVLGTKLSGSGANPAQAFEEVRMFAHRLRGAAAIFGAAEVRDAAQALELATQAAQSELATREDSRVWSALALLSDLLASMTESITAPALTLVSRQGTRAS